MHLLLVFSRVSALLAIVVGILVILGWLLDIEVLKSLSSGFVSMKANTALCFVLLGISLLLFHFAAEKRRIQFLSHLMAWLVITIGLLTIFEYVFSVDLWIDQLFVREEDNALATYSPGRMALNSAVCFVLAGLALITIDLKTGTRLLISQVLALILIFISLLPLIGYIYGIADLYQYAQFTSMAIHTATTFFIVGLGIFCFRPDTAIVSVFLMDNLGGYIIRRLFPILLVLPLVLVWLRIAAENTGFYSSLFGLQLISSFIISLFILMIWKVAKSVNLLETNLRDSAGELSQLNERFLLAARAANFGVWDWNAAENKNVWDDRMWELYGMNKNETAPVEEVWLEAVHPEDRQFLQQEVNEVFAGGKDYNTEFRVVWPDGSIKYLKSFGQLVRDDQGKPLRMTGVSYDITQRKTSEYELKKSEERFRTTLENMIEGCQIVGFDWRYIYINKMAEKHNRREKAEMIGKKMTDVWPGIDQTEVFAMEKKCMTERTIQYMENHFVFPDGKAGWFELRMQPVPEGILILSVDITERKTAEKELIASEKQYKYLFENNPQPMWIFETGTLAFLEVNKAAVRHYGYSREEFLKMNILDIRPPEDIEMVRAVSNSEKVENYPGVWRHLKKSGELIFVEIKAHLISYEGRSARLVLIIDVTERKKADEEIKKWNQELEQRVTERTRQLSESNKELESFAYSVSHDLRAPLRHVIGFSEKLERTLAGAGDSETDRLTGKIKNSASKMGQLIDELLTYSRLGRTDLKKQPVRLSEIVDEVVKDASDLPGSGVIEWKVQPLPEVFADAMLIKLVFQNLINNAVKFTGKKDKALIEISCNDTGKNEYTFMVKDNGAGFNIEYASKLFGVFQRLHTTQEFEGTGIGLATVRRIVSRHGGRVWAEGEENIGAAFYFTLPKKKQDHVKQ